MPEAPFNLVQRPDANAADIYLYAAIGTPPSPLDTLLGETQPIDAATVAQWLAQVPQTYALNVYMHSPGGQVQEGLAIYEQLRRWPGQVTTHVDGEVASIASIIALAGNTRRMAGSATFHIHTAAGSMQGRPTASHHRATAEELDRINAQLTAIYVERSNMDESAVDALMTDQGTTLAASDAQSRGLIDEIVNPLQATAMFRPLQAYASKGETGDVADLQARITDAYKQGFEAAKQQMGAPAAKLAQALETKVNQTHRPAFRALIEKGEYEAATQYIETKQVADLRGVFQNVRDDSALASQAPETAKEKLERLRRDAPEWLNANPSEARRLKAEAFGTK
jgi:ATP-dependent Clp protease protease subunit